MYKKMFETMEFTKILSMLKEFALSEQARNKIKQLEPFLSKSEAMRHLNETTQAKLIIETAGTPPLSGMNELEKSLALLNIGVLLAPEQLSNIAQFICTCNRLKVFLKKAESTGADVAFYGNSIFDLWNIEKAIDCAIKNNMVEDKASPTLANIRRKITNTQIALKSKLDALLNNKKNWFSEGFVSNRNGHFTLPVKKEYKNNLTGSVIDVSQSGSTYFIEPAAVQKFKESISILQIEEDNEVKRILYTLTTLVEDHLPMILINIEAMECLDFIFAKAKLSLSMGARPLPILTERKIEIKNGRHPLLKTDIAVPLNFSLGGEKTGIIITGPNTGARQLPLKRLDFYR